jgi:hypothetical protein
MLKATNNKNTLFVEKKITATVRTTTLSEIVKQETTTI